MTETGNFLHYLRPLALAFVRVTGTYAPASRLAWSQMTDWADQEGFRPEPGQLGYGLLHDDPKTIPAGECRYDACIELTPACDAAVRGKLPMQRTKGGVHLCRNHVGPVTDLAQSFSAVCQDPLLSSDLRIDPARPIIVTYLNDPRATPPHEQRATLNLPVRWRHGNGRKAA